MDLQELNSSLPKSWLNIQSNSFVSPQILSSDSGFSSLSSTGTLTPNQIVNGTLGFGSGVVSSWNLPNSIQLTSYVNPNNLLSNISFQCYIFTSSSTILTLTLSSMETYTGATTITIGTTTASQKVLTFSYNASLSGNWTVYV